MDSKPITVILGCICIFTVLLVVFFKPWEVIKATPQTRATPTALIDDNSIIASEHTLDINPPMLPTQATSNELIEIIVDLAEDVTALQERVDRLENQSDVIPESKKKNNWLRFDSKRRSSN
jgi:hypothetical protein